MSQGIVGATTSALEICSSIPEDSGWWGKRRISSGAGGASLVGIAPAVANAIFDATGVRLRSMPLVPNGLKISSAG
jgi:hypothetical protein